MPSTFRVSVSIAIALAIAFAQGAVAQPTQRDVLRSGSTRLVKLQADRTADNSGNGFTDGDPDDAGWDADVATADTGHSSRTSPPNTYGVTAIGMALSYQRNSATFNTFIACLDAYSSMASDPAIVSGADPTFLFLMRRLTQDNTFANEARAKWNLAIDALGGGDVAAAAQAIKQRRVTEGNPDLYPWDIAWFVISANRLEKLFPGQGYTLESTIFAQAVLNDLLSQTPVFDVNDTTKNFYDIGLVGAALALRVPGLAPTQYNSLLDRIVARQNADGSWGFNDPHRAGNVPTTAYAAIVCKLFRNRLDATNAKNAAANWLVASQMTNGGFHYYCGFDESPEANGEALFAINLVGPSAPVTPPCSPTPPTPVCLNGPAATQSYYYDGTNGLLNPSDGRNWVATLTGLDGSSVAGNKIYRLMVQDQGPGTGFQTLAIEVRHDAAGAGGHLLQSKDIDFAVRSSHSFATGEVAGTFDVRLEFQQRVDRKWDVIPQYRLPGGAWTIFAGGSWTTATAFDLTATRLSVQIDGGAAGTLCFVPPTGEPRPRTTLVLSPIVIGIAVPSAPVFTGTSPTSPANANGPSIQGTAEAGATVRLYTASDCSGAPVATGTAAPGGTFSIPVSVANNTTTTFYATASDGVGNTSLCSASGITYVEDSAAPAAPAVTGTSPVSPSNDNAPIVTGTAEVGATVDVFPNASCTGSPSGSGAANIFGAFNVTVTVVDGSTTNFHARATDAAGNVSPCSATSTTYVEDSSAPAAPTLTGTSPASPANNNAPNVQGGAEAGSTVSLYATAACSGAPLATGTASGGGSFSIPVTVDDDTTTTFYATATDVAGNVSACTATGLAYVEDSSTPAAPSLTSTTPTSPANSNGPSILGTAEAGSTVRLYTSAACSGAPAGTGTASGGGSFSIPVTVGNDTTTTFYATATDAAGNVSTCSATGITYVEDSSPPSAPVILSTSPTSPANNNTPSIIGSADPGSTVRIYVTAACTGAIFGTGTASGGGSFSIPVTVGNDTTTTFYATATDAAGNASTCSATGITYVEDSSPPSGPVMLSTSPASPANNNGPSIVGTAEAGATVELYTSAACSGAPAGTGTATGGGSFSIPVTVGNDTTTTFYATATDAAGNVSTCSATGITYVEDSSPPSAPVILSTSPTSPANNNTPSIVGSADPGSTVRIYVTAACTGAIFGTGTASGGGSFSIPVTVGDDTTTTFHASATDAAGNVSTCSATGITYLEDSSPPSAPMNLSTSPASPANNNGPSIVGTAEAGATVELYTSAACSGAPAGTGTATGGGSFSIPVTVGNNTTTTFFATATDGAGNVSGCSASGTSYTEDSTAPSFSGASGANAISSSQITVDWVAATDTVSPSFLIVYDVCVSTASGSCGTSFSIQQTSAAGATSVTVGGLNPNTPYFFVVRARDVAGNEDGNTVETTATTLP